MKAPFSLREDRADLQDLAQERFQVEILLLEELKGGRTGALLYLVSLAPDPSRGLAPAGAGPVRHLVLKLDRRPDRFAQTCQVSSPHDEIEQHKQALALAPPRFRPPAHRRARLQVRDGEQIAVFSAIAGGRCSNSARQFAR